MPRIQPRPGQNYQEREWELQREEEDMAGQVVHYRNVDGDHDTWLGKRGEEPPKKIRELLSPSYSPTTASRPRTKYSTSGCTLEEVPAMLALRLGQRYELFLKITTEY